MNSEFHSRKRQDLLEKLPESSLAIFYSGKAPRKSADAFYPFEVDKNFLYLTGIDRQDMILVVAKMRRETTSLMYIPPVKEHTEKWHGLLMREAEARQVSGIEMILDIRDFENDLFGKLSNVIDQPKAVYLFIHQSAAHEPLNWEKELAKKIKRHFPFIPIENSYNILAAMRSIKEPEELHALRRAIDLTAQGFDNVRNHLQPGMYEYEARAYFEEILLHHSSIPSFDTISASGWNATILHYTTAQRQMNAADLLLFDAGAQFEHYCADVTRTYAVNGVFSPRQKDIYQIVLACLHYACEMMRPDVTLVNLNQQILEFFLKELHQVNLAETLADVRKYFYHGIGHPLGLDTHDIRNPNEILQEGMVYTVEPGLYIGAENLGVRIEDNVLITSGSPEVLTQMILK